MLISLQMTMTKMESSTLAFDTTHPIVCRSNELPVISNALLNESTLNAIYDVGTKLIFKCSFGYESLNNQTSFTVCSTNGTWTINTIHPNICQLSKHEGKGQHNGKIILVESETTEKISVNTATISPILTEESTSHDYFDESLPVLNISNETFLTPTQSMSAGNRQIRQVTSYCEQYPQIDHAQILSDDTVTHNFSNKISYSGSILFVCQFGFLSDTSDDEPFRLTCQDGVFHPKVTCLGKSIFVLKEISTIISSLLCKEKPRCPLPPPIDFTRSSVIDSVIKVFDTSTEEAIPGSFVTLNCVDKKTDEKSVFNMTCLDNGKWLPPPPPCIGMN